MEWLSVEYAWIWMFSLGLILAVMEIFVPAFVMLPVGIAFIITAFISFTLDSWTAVFVYAGLTSLVVFFFFKMFFKKAPSQSSYASNSEALVGQTATVFQEIPGGGQTGYVKIYADEWRALSKTGAPIAQGARVRVLSFSGNTLTVELCEEIS